MRISDRWQTHCRFPAFAGFDPDDFLKPNRVNTDNNNFGPAFGLAWSPSFRSGWLHKLFGEDKTVWRGGFKSVTTRSSRRCSHCLLAVYATEWHQHRTLPGLSTGRGTPNWFEQLPAVATRSQPAGYPTGRPRERPSQPLHGALVIWLPAAAFQQTRDRWFLCRLGEPQAHDLGRSQPAGQADNRAASSSGLRSREIFAPARGIRPTTPCSGAWIAALHADFRRRRPIPGRGTWTAPARESAATSSNLL